MCPDTGAVGAKWNNIRVIMFTEWDDTRRYLVQQLTAAISESDRAENVSQFSMALTSSEDREAIKTAFNPIPPKSGPNPDCDRRCPRRPNLQAHCWNIFTSTCVESSRMEQRNGRIDRKLQPNPVVYCHLLLLYANVRKTGPSRAGSKNQDIRENLGACPR